MILKYDFYNDTPINSAKKLLGKILIHRTHQGIISGRITETEAYEDKKDEAAHSYKGITKRNKSLFLKGGHIYLHKIHTQICLDIVLGQENEGGSVLIRALEPIEGIELMKINRNTDNIYNLTTGPGKLTRALGINFSQDGINITEEKSAIYLVSDEFVLEETNITQTTRIGISKAKEFLNRFYIKDSKFISKK